MPNLDVTKEQAASCTRCPLCCSGTRLVFEDGARTGHIMLIGEAPGEQEDRTGKPFVGPAGQLLDALIFRTGLYRDRHFYITNTVKHRPPNNRVPTEDEMDACSLYLFEQLRAVKPDIVLLVGGTAWKFFSGSSEGITKARGKWYAIEGYLTMPVLHPSYILRSQPKWPDKSHFMRPNERGTLILNVEAYNLAAVDQAEAGTPLASTRNDFLTMKFRYDQIWTSQIIHPSVRDLWRK